MLHRLTQVVILAALATITVRIAPAAADDWWGSATCNIDAQRAADPKTGLGGVMSDEIHTWTIVIPQQKTSSGATTEYLENWTVSGSGGNDEYSWITNGKASGGTIGVYVSASDGKRHIVRYSGGQQTDPQGILVTPKAGGNQFSASVGELEFPDIPGADPNDKVIAGNSSTTTTGTGGRYLVPNDSTLVTTCSWNFQYGAPPLMVLYAPPVSVTLSVPHSVSGELKRLEEGKPKPGGIGPAVPTTLSISFGGPGGGNVGAPMKFSCLSDCTPPVGLSEGATITLTATPDASSLFAGWGGSCSGTIATCTVTLGASNRVTAYFRSKFKSVAAGAYHTCALRPAGDVECWGINAEGEIGAGGSPTGPLAPSAVMGITTAVAIAAGGYHTCALLVGGTVTCWGKGNDGQLGDPSFPASASTPMTVPGISEALAVTAGGAHTCAVLAGGSASCWGLNDNQQLGASTPSYHSPTPVTVSTVGPLTKQIAAGAYHTCAIVAADSTVACWGLNSDGQAPARVVITGPGSGGPAAGCIIPPGGGDCDLSAGSGDIAAIYLNKVTTIAASIGVGQLLGGPPLGGYHTVALDSSGADWGWGNNSDGQIPDGAGDQYAMKDPSPPGPTPTKIAAGAYHTCILAGPAGVFCRGLNGDSQSGPTPPGIVPTTASAVDVAAGGYHTCAVIVTPATPADGSVECWGLNWNGEVDGTSGGPAVTSPKVLTAVP